MISGHDGPPGTAGAPAAGMPGTRPNWTTRLCPLSATQTCPAAVTATPCGNARSSPARAGAACRPNSV